jgi:hypothetical protein
MVSRITPLAKANHRSSSLKIVEFHQCWPWLKFALNGHVANFKLQKNVTNFTNYSQNNRTPSEHL